ncbi:pyridoxamine 5'-phosphate oxidase family protein [Treponema socranskii]|uniref:pyridoxamine 5'-phosphate oxidase family protein n=1 Tax=Treponema socranskii TaxID=53419 RepID=UPI0023F17D25|nr:pyridoxamine 5'-phosphate oxidase family protein [Treponema socranskii]
MRRKDREVTDIRQIESIIEKAKVVHIGMIDSGAPYVVPMQYGYVFTDGALTLYLHSAQEGRKIDCIKKNQNVCIELETDIAPISGGDIPCKYSSAYASVMGDGTAEIVEDPKEKVFGLESIMKTQTGKAFTVSEEMAAAVSVIKISVPRVTAKSRPSQAPKDVRQENRAIKSGDVESAVPENRVSERAASEIEKPETERQIEGRSPKQTMYLLVFNQNGNETPVALFENIDEARKNLRSVPGYTMTEIRDGDFCDVRETLSPGKLPDYTEIEYNGNRIPLSRFMFPDPDDAEIIWREIPNMETANRGLADGCTRVDAYVIDNEEVKAYIEKRERLYERAKVLLKRQGCEVDRSFFGSEDGEAIVYKKKGESDWHFLIHMDPSFVDGAPDDEKDFERRLEEDMQ